MVFESELAEAQVKAALEAQLLAFAGKTVGVLIRTAAELATALAENPFPDHAPNRVVVLFLDAAPPAELGVRGLRQEEIRLGRREIYVHYGDGMADSKLKIAAAAAGTGRNINTLAKLAEMAGRR